MLNTRILLCALGLVTATALHAGETIEVEKLAKPQLREAMKKAPDDTVFEFQGVKKTKAQWRSEERAKYKAMDPAKVKELERERNTKFVARQKELDDEQDARIEAQNAQTMAKFNELRLGQTANGREFSK
jgi:hypothetical protein